MKEIRYYYGFDFLRSIMIILIVCWHTGLMGSLEILDFNQYYDHNIPIPNIICLQLFMLAVPVFFLISLFLLTNNLESEKNYSFKRLERLLYLYIFWTGIYCLVFYRKGFHIFPEIFKQGPSDIFYFIACGGVSAFWFLFSLLFLTIITIICIRLSKLVLYILLIIFTSYLWIGPIIGITTTPKIYYWSQWWVPFIHLPYVPIAILFSRYAKSLTEWNSNKILKLALILSVIYIITSICEWNWILYRSDEINFGRITTYARISVVAGASLLFTLSFLVKKPAKKIVVFLSQHSLGIYCIHILAMSAWMPKNWRFNLTYTSTILIISIIGAYFLRRAMRKGLI